MPRTPATPRRRLSLGIGYDDLDEEGEGEEERMMWRSRRERPEDFAISYWPITGIFLETDPMRRETDWMKLEGRL